MVGYGIGIYASASTFAMVSLYLPYFYTDVFLLTPTVMAILFLSCRIWDGINDPIMGMIADGTESRWGKFRPYLLFAPFLMIVFGTLTFTAPDMSTTGKIIWAFATYVPLQMIKTVISVPYYSIMPIMTTDVRERTIISSIQQMATPLAFVVASFFVLRIVGLFPNESEGFLYSALIFCIIAAIVMWVTFLSTRSYDYPGNPLFQRDDDHRKVVIKEKLKVITRNRPLVIVVSSFSMLNLSTAVTQGVALYFFKYNLDMVDIFPLFIGLTVLATMVGAALAPALVKKLGKKNLLQISNLISFVIGLTLIYLSYGKDQTALRELWYPGRVCFVLAVVTQPFNGIVAVMLGALLPDCVEFAEWKTGLRAEGLINSLYLMANKAGYALGGGILGVALALFQYKPNQPTYSEATLAGFLLLLFGVSAICRIALGLLMLFHNVSESRFLEILEELKTRKRSDSAGK
jgi:sugar (glycoside-pentoside-hexuronide) transporter